VIFNRPQFPLSRMRRVRSSQWTRELVAEAQLSPHHLIMPLFVSDGEKTTPITSMPGQYRFTETDLVDKIASLNKLGLHNFALFPHVSEQFKSPNGEESLNSEGLIPRVMRAIRDRFSDINLIADIALDPYTSHGQDGIIDNNGYVLNDETIEMLQKQAVVVAKSGANIVAPSDMMDGRILKIRQKLDANNLEQTMILAYSAKYASCFYGPFRDAVGSASNLKSSSKETYQMDVRNRIEASEEASLDISEGADFLMVKPALPYLDIISDIKTQFGVPTFAYQVSGEYSMIKAAGKLGYLDEQKAMIESLTCIRRAGANAILTYFAEEYALMIKEAHNRD
jgi:porphobilinogen synthase